MLRKFNVKGNKSPAVKNWQTHDGPVTSPMFGVQVPDGVYIIDLDLYKGVTTADVDKALGCSLDWDGAELQKTKNGGIHYAFQCHDEMKQGSNLLGVDGFDTRSAGKGYIATGKGYTDISLFGFDSALMESDLLPRLPAGAIDKLRVRPPKQELSLVVDNDLGALEQAIAAQPLDISEAEQQHYIDALGDEYAIEQDLWLRVGMGIYHQTSGSEQGYLMFDEFSKRGGDKYDERANRLRWESFNNSSKNPTTFASIIHAAGGKAVIAKDIFQDMIGDIAACDDHTKVEAIIKTISDASLDSLSTGLLLKNAQSKIKALTGAAPSLPELKHLARGQVVRENIGFVEEYVFVTSTNKFFHRSTKAVMVAEAFNVKHGRDVPQTEEGKTEKAAAFATNVGIRCVQADMYIPSFGEIFHHEGCDYINSYRKSDLQPVPVGTTDVVDRVKRQIAHLLPNEYEQSIFTNYLAHCVQYAGKKIPWAILLQGIQGDGKSFFLEMMKLVMGKDNVRTLNASDLNSDFTAWAEGQCLSFIEELKLDNKQKHDTLNKIKPFITNKEVSVHAKGVDPYDVPNTTNYIGLTNFKDALPIDNTDRRYCVLFSQWQNAEDLAAFEAENIGYYHDLHNAMRANAGEILTWLTDHPIPDEFKAMQRAPITDAKVEMIEANKSSKGDLVENAIAVLGNGHPAIRMDFLNVTLLSRLVAEQNTITKEFKDFPSTQSLPYVLTELGMVKLRKWKSPQPDGRKYTFWGDPSITEAQSLSMAKSTYEPSNDIDIGFDVLADGGQDGGQIVEPPF